MSNATVAKQFNKNIALYRGMAYEYDERWDEYIVYDENYCPISRSFDTLEEVTEFIDYWAEAV